MANVPPSRFEAFRLLVALDDLTQEQALLLNAGDYDEALALGRRIAPLTEHLRALASELTTPVMCLRASAVIERWRKCADQLHGRMKHALDESDRLATARRRLESLAPAYGHRPRPALLEASV